VKRLANIVFDMLVMLVLFASGMLVRITNG